ncbi:MAG: cytochrome c oxidase assembly protein [Microbacteriaceae bacterium]|nr:cytochrome c oxidase assembly protein [Microbacteriaceae bacterium]
MSSSTKPLLNRLLGWVVPASAVVVTAPLATTLLLGREPYEIINRQFPGFDVAMTATILRAVAEISSLVALGALIFMIFVRETDAKTGRLKNPDIGLQILRWASGLMAIITGALIIFDALDTTGARLEQLSQPGAFGILFESSYYPLAWTFNFIVASAVYFSTFFIRTWLGLLLPFWGLSLAVMWPVVVGQVLVGPNHDFGSDAAILQTIGVYAFFGTLVAAAISTLLGKRLTAFEITRISRISKFALPLLTLTELLIAWFKLAGTSPAESFTGQMLTLRILVLALLWVVFIPLWASRAYKFTRGSDKDAKSAREATVTKFNRVLFGGSALIVAWLAIGLAINRVPSPHYFEPVTIPQIIMGYNVEDAPTFQVLVTHWRPNVLYLVLAITAISAYFYAVRVLHKRGDKWPLGRTIAWTLGWIVVIIATSSGFGVYSAADFGIHMIVHMTLNMLAPLLMVLGGFMTLLLRASSGRSDNDIRDPSIAGMHNWITWILKWRVLRVIYNPLLVFVVFILSYYGLYLTGIFENIMLYHWAHQLMNLHFIFIGYLYYGLSIGVDRVPRALPHIGKLGYVMAAMPFHAFFGVVLMTTPTPVAENYYKYLDMPWADLQASQYLGGSVAWSAGEIPLLIVVLVLGIQWARQDDKEARRKDRHMDLGLDDDLTEYNEMLKKLAERQGKLER